MRKHTNAHDRNALGMCKGNRFTGRTASITGTGAQVISVQANLKYGGNAGYLLSHGLHAAQREDEPSGTSTPCGTHCGRLHVAEASNMLPANRRERQMSAGARALHLIQTQAPRRAAPPAQQLNIIARARARAAEAADPHAKGCRNKGSTVYLSSLKQVRRDPSLFNRKSLRLRGRHQSTAAPGRLAPGTHTPPRPAPPRPAMDCERGYDGGVTCGLPISGGIASSSAYTRRVHAELVRTNGGRKTNIVGEEQN